MKKEKVCVLFAGVVGSSKTPIANFLSGKLGLPIYNNDVVRTEVLEDLCVFNQDEYLKRIDERLRDIVNRKVPFILDASIDRTWKEVKEALIEAGYQWFIISLDLSKDLLVKFHDIKDYKEPYEGWLDQLINEHEIFLKEFGQEINLNIQDKDFPNRLQLSFEAVDKWIN